ncbi:pyridoxal-phosphate dependent enzyme [Sulfitobacter guttiformis]|uniref:Threonine dehydratase n=1 Tax=Sulfitobacter guttiformis TaxID=74349 RepID=A0A420DSP3_9RHOB|nr:pyridoxal-phosphate dependent enzyme [Sulfitobacter guttiformis]KIN74779.1 Threonine dehydratase catabolic [Sulfitobacter guttiformis KCTC 32187]RKE97351.1 threonine dehydratase [Sulfitobacter guttiformis]
MTMLTPDLGALSLGAIRANSADLAGDILRTPCLTLDTGVLARILGGGAAVLKLECFQHTGTFKARGALSVARSLDAEQRTRGITAASAGNHAIAAAWAARQIGASAKVVIQSNANPFRVALARAEGAEVIMKAPGAETFAEAERLVQMEGRYFIHPFEGPLTSLGTAGVGLELMEDAPGLDAVVVSIGGGGLISGIAAAVKQMNPDCKVYGVEPVGAAGMYQSLQTGSPVRLDGVNTVADSLGAPMAMPLGFALCSAYVDEVLLLEDDTICAGMVAFQQEAKLAVEPAAGAALAAVMGPLRDRLQGKRVGVIVCGANIDAQSYLALMTRGMPAFDTMIKC